MNPSFLCHQHWNSHDNQIRSSQHVNPSYSYWDLLYLKSLEFYLKPLNITVLVLCMLSKSKRLSWCLEMEVCQASKMQMSLKQSTFSTCWNHAHVSAQGSLPFSTLLQWDKFHMAEVLWHTSYCKRYPIWDLENSSKTLNKIDTINLYFDIQKDC